MALSGHARRVGRCPLMGVKRTLKNLDFRRYARQPALNQAQELSWNSNIGGLKPGREAPKGGGKTRLQGVTGDINFTIIGHSAGEPYNEARTEQSPRDGRK
jgi:hypothetical protein